MSRQQYLSRHAEPEAALVTAIDASYDHVLCIPAFAENPDFADAVTRKLPVPATLCIVVANAPENADRRKAAQTRAIVDHLLASAASRQSLAANLWLLQRPAGPDVLLVDRCRPGYCLPAGGGVGQARKIACDMALALHAMGAIRSPWIHTTDADARLPADYFSATSSLDGRRVSAAVYPFRHTRHRDEKIDLAQRLYEASLNYYVAGLRWAGSPWAFHTIGSTLAINGHHYAQARGVPKRRAAEDFYLLNKLAKIGGIVSLETSPVVLESRLSDRVPFGTGPALQKISMMADPESGFLFYHPHCFVYLKAWLALSRALWDAGGGAPGTACLHSVLATGDGFDAVDEAVLKACLADQDIARAIEHAFAHSTSRDVFDRHINNWFDAFRTLKFMHWLRDKHLPSMPLACFAEHRRYPFTWTLSELQTAPG